MSNCGPQVTAVSAAAVSWPLQWEKRINKERNCTTQLVKSDTTMTWAQPRRRCVAATLLSDSDDRGRRSRENYPSNQHLSLSQCYHPPPLSCTFAEPTNRWPHWNNSLYSTSSTLCNTHTQCRARQELRQLLAQKTGILGRVVKLAWKDNRLDIIACIELPPPPTTSDLHDAPGKQYCRHSHNSRSQQRRVSFDKQAVLISNDSNDTLLWTQCVLFVTTRRSRPFAHGPIF